MFLDKTQNTNTSDEQGCICQITRGRLSARPEGPTLEARWTESDGRGFWQFLGGPPPHQLGGLGERCKLPSGVENVEFSTFWDLKIASRECKLMMQTAFNIHTDTAYL